LSWWVVFAIITITFVIPVVVIVESGAILGIFGALEITYLIAGGTRTITIKTKTTVFRFIVAKINYRAATTQPP